MRKYISLFIVIFLFGLMACTQVENNIYCPTGERVNVTVVASQDDSQTKTHIGEHYSEGGYAVLWDESGESIALMERVTRNGEFSVQTVVSGDYTLSEDAKTATFMGLGLVANETSEGSTFDYVVISPSSAINMDTGDFSETELLLPAVQKPKDGSYDPLASILIGSSLGNGTQAEVVEADLTHILAYAKMTVKNVPTDDKIETVEFITEKDIYGTVLKYNIEDGTVGSDSSIMSVKMDVSSILQSGESFDVYFTALPAEFSPGDKFSVKVSTADRLYVKEWTMTDTKKFDLISQSVLTFSVDMEDAEVGEVEWPVPDNEIWYRTADNQKYDIYHSTNTYGHQPFDAEIVSHTYENGIGKIKCDNTITKINDSAFGNGWGHKLSELYLPETIEIIETYGIRGNEYLTTLRIPKNLKSVGSGGLNNPNLESFTGSHITEDGRCVIIEDGFMPNYGDTQTPVKNYLAAFAPAGITEYTLPDNVEILGWYAFAWCPELPKITFNEGLKTIMGDCFYESHLDCEIILPSTLENLDPYAFHSCSGIKGFYGNEKFHTSDHLCLIFEQTAYCDQPEKNGIWINRFVGYDITDYSIPEGIKGIENYSFDQMPNLKTVTLPSSIVEVGAYAFNHCNNLEALYGECVSDDHKAIVFGTQFRKLVVTKDVVSYTLPDDIISIGYCAFVENPEIETITMGDQVTTIDGYAFAWCPNLKSITLSAGLKDISGYNAFLDSDKLETIYCRALVPPSYGDYQMSEFPNLKFYVPEQSLALYQNHAGWAPFKNYFVGYNYTDLPEIDTYISSDYSNDGKVITLQTATKGNGINIVLMGDAYSDRQIADGTYKEDMENLYNNLFTEEPYKSFKDHFNVHYVSIVSATEGYEYSGATLGGFFGNGTYVGGNDNVVFNYALKAISEEEMDEALLIVAMNSDNYAGTCYMYYPESVTGTYGSGPSVAYFPRGGDAETFASLLHHEACGHGFAKLGDEYAYEDYGEAPADYIAQTKQHQDSWGWWKNVDFTDDPSEVRWNYFLSDERYANDGLGVFEGGLTYWSGVWRPTENSIMRYNTGGFNAPSREAIYYRIHKLAYGADWEYNYEDFVEYDSVNRKSASEAAAVSATKYVYQPKPQLHAPVVINKTWRDAE